MNKRTPSIEWTIAASDAEWERSQELTLPDGEPVAHPHRPLQHYLWGAAVLFLLLGITGDWWWRTTQLRAHQAVADAPAQQQLKGMAQNGDHSATSSPADQNGRNVSSLRAAVQTADPIAYLQIELHRLGFQGDQAVAQLVTTLNTGVPVYRQTHFYRRTATGWVQTAPNPALWGPEHSLETPYFIYHFRQNDAEAVIAVAPQVDALYTTLWRNFGLPLTSLTDQQVHVPLIPGTEKLVIEVSVTQPTGQALPWLPVSDRLLVPSPALYLAPIERSDAELLEQSIALPLLNYVLAQARQRHAIGPAWQPMLSGLRLWQLWDLDLPLADRHQEVVRWIYQDLPAASHRQPVVLPAHYEELCATYQLWMPMPALLEIPLFCSEFDRDVSFFSILGRRDPLTRLDQLGLPGWPDEQGTYMSYLPQLQLPTRPVALATLIEYAVSTYGRERLPALLAGLEQYDSWETLIPAVFGVSTAEFEAGWQTYLKAHYGIISAN